MKNRKGISAISVVVTVVVIIILSSVTIFSGQNMLKKARQSKAEERLETIYQALVKDEEALHIGDTVPKRAIQAEDYIALGLDSYAKDASLPEVTFSKRIGGIADADNTSKRTYHLETLLTKNGKENCTIDREYTVSPNTFSTAVAFDVIAGVNRPQLTSDMKAINFANDELGEYVEDIYEEHWYDYDSKTPNYANMELKVERDSQTESVLYVWIPRFAYHIQDYYAENVMPNVPDSAMEIVFLRGTSNLMANGEILPDGYRVHPAFTFEGEELAGIWVEKYAFETTDNISDTFDLAKSYYQRENANSHLLTAQEWGAMAYLAQTNAAAKNAESTTNNISGISDIITIYKEYLSAYANISSSSVLRNNGQSLIEASDGYKTVYNAPGAGETFYTANAFVVGDAIVETSNGKTENSAWYNSKSILPTAEKPFFVKNTGDSLFGFETSNGDERVAQFRSAIVVLEGND